MLKFKFSAGPVNFNVDLPKSLNISLPIPISSAYALEIATSGKVSGAFFERQTRQQAAFQLVIDCRCRCEKGDGVGRSHRHDQAHCLPRNAERERQDRDGNCRQEDRKSRDRVAN